MDEALDAGPRNIADGATLRFALGARPDRSWGTAASSAPPSYSPTSRSACRRWGTGSGPLLRCSSLNARIASRAFAL